MRLLLVAAAVFVANQVTAAIVLALAGVASMEGSALSAIPIGRKHTRLLSVSERVDELHETLTPAVNAAINNETLTRGRVAKLEALLNRDLWGRLSWLLIGK